jgi:carboxymethylenebutenolidase
MRTIRRIGPTVPMVMALATVTVWGCTAAEEAPESSGRASTVPAQVDTLPSAVWGRADPPSGENVAYYAGDEAAVGYLAVPDGEGPFPAVILIHEWNGLVDRIRQVADAMAAEGYVALAVDLYSGRVGTNRDENIALMQETQGNTEQTIANLDAAARFLRSRNDVTGKVASMGWCFGGGIALSYALGGKDHEGTAIFYGSLVTDPEVLGSIQHEVYGTFAEMDGGIPPEQVEEFVAALQSSGIENDVHVYDAVDHGFWLRVEENADLREAPALDAWRRLQAYLGRTLSQ